MSKLKFAFSSVLVLSLFTLTVQAQRLTLRLGNPVLKNVVISAPILHEGTFELQRSIVGLTNWTSITNFNSLPGTNNFADSRSNKQSYYRLFRRTDQPVITAQPLGTTNFIGQEVRLESAATGSWPIRYQWFRNNQPLSGATSNKLVFNGAVNLSGNYYWVVSNTWGRATSSVAVVQTTDPAPATISGKKIRYLIKEAQGNYIGTGSFETTYFAPGHYGTASSNAFLVDQGNWQYGRLSTPGMGRAILSGGFVYLNSAVIDMTFNSLTNGTYLLQEPGRAGGQAGDFTILP